MYLICRVRRMAGDGGRGVADTLESLARHWSADLRLLVRRVIDAAEPVDRRSALDELADYLGGNQSSFVHQLLQVKSVAGHRLALELIAGMDRPAVELVQDAIRAMDNKTIPVSVRVAAVRSILRTTGPAGPQAVRLLRSLANSLPRRRRLDRLEMVAKRLGDPAALNVIRTELYEQQKLRCPRCGQMERRQDMVEHLWNRHLLLLDGHRARNAFQILDDRVHDPDLEVALAELNRALLARGLKDDEAAEHLSANAAAQHESLCPQCFSFSSVPEPPVPPPANLSHHRLSADGCIVELDEQSWQPWLHIATADQDLFAGPEPERGWSPIVWRWLGVVSAILGVWAAALLPNPWHALTGAALVAEGVLLQFWASRLERRWANARERIVNYAWQRLIPELPAGRTSARIALASLGLGSVAKRMENLQLAIAAAETAARGQAIPASTVAPLWWLQAEDQRRKGRDAIPTIAGRLGSCFSNDIPMAAGAALCDLWEERVHSKADAARLRVLATEQAIIHGIEVWDLLELSRAFPTLGRVIAAEDLDGLARLRLIWERRKERPWAACGPAVTVFELARYPVIAALAFETAPDVLLYQPLPPPGPKDDPLPLLLCGRGMVIGELVIRAAPDTITVRRRDTWRGGGYELCIDARRLPFAHDPDELADRIRRWSAYWFREFLPQVDHVLKYRATAQVTELLRPAIAECRLCRQRHAVVPGSIGFVPTT